MKLFIKPFLLKGIKEHGTAPTYRRDVRLRRSGTINGKKVVFVRAPTPKRSFRVSFEWEQIWYYVDNQRDLYQLVESGSDNSPFLDFYVD